MYKWDSLTLKNKNKIGRRQHDLSAHCLPVPFSSVRMVAWRWCTLWRWRGFARKIISCKFSRTWTWHASLCCPMISCCKRVKISMKVTSISRAPQILQKTCHRIKLKWYANKKPKKTLNHCLAWANKIPSKYESQKKFDVTLQERTLRAKSCSLVVPLVAYNCNIVSSNLLRTNSTDIYVPTVLFNVFVCGSGPSRLLGFRVWGLHCSVHLLQTLSFWFIPAKTLPWVGVLCLEKKTHQEAPFASAQ